VEEVEIEFSAADTVTFSSWRTVPYSGDGSDEIRMRVAHLLKDYWGAGHWVDGMPDYEPTYLYPFDTERVEVGFKRIQDRQSDPETENPDDLRSLKSLARWVNEQQYGEVLLEPTYNTATVAAALTDADLDTLGTPYWGDYDEDGFGLHCGIDNDVWFGGHIIYCDVILQGGARGISKRKGQRQTARDAYVNLYYSDDGGTTKQAVSDADTDAQGMYRIGAGREKTPRTYYLWTNQWFSLGSFVNAEEAWAVVEGSGPPIGDGPVMGIHPAGYPVYAWMDTDSGEIRANAIHTGVATEGSYVVIDDSGDYDRMVSTGHNGRVWYVIASRAADSVPCVWYSYDMGATWTGPAEAQGSAAGEGVPL